MQSTRGVTIGIGANVAGAWGKPDAAITRALRELRQAGFDVVSRSRTITTKAVGAVRQPDFRNMVVHVEGAMAPATLLRLLKRLERAAGRRRNVRWGPRPLDLDILDFGGRVLAPRATRSSGHYLALPHPEMHRRAFVLVPLAEIRPHWRHPRLGRDAVQLLRALKFRRRSRSRAAA